MTLTSTKSAYGIFSSNRSYPQCRIRNECLKVHAVFHVQDGPLWAARNTAAAAFLTPGFRRRACECRHPRFRPSSWLRRGTCRSPPHPWPRWCRARRSRHFEMTFLELFRRSAPTASTARSMPPLEVHRIHAGGDRLGAFCHDAWADTVASGAIGGRVSGLGGEFAHHLGAHSFELILELDLLGDGDAVLADAGSAERLVEQDVVAFRIHPS
ncbi:hypothetical protein ACVWW4_004055 [Bradyrhizobium sp. LB7.1]